MAKMLDKVSRNIESSLFPGSCQKISALSGTQNCQQSLFTKTDEKDFVLIAPVFLFISDPSKCCWFYSNITLIR